MTDADTNEGERFPAFPKIPRLRRRVVVTEKIDGTNALISISPEGTIRAGSRSRWITPEADNFGFARWVSENAADLAKLGPGHHYGEWYGAGIQRRYGLDHKRFALFNAGRWSDPESRPACVGCVPILADGIGETVIEGAIDRLRAEGSIAVPGFMRPEGVVVWHSASGSLYKVLLEGDETPKGEGGR
jgi:hypothetical protein